MNTGRPAGASLLAKNDDALCLQHRVVRFANRLAPAGGSVRSWNHG
ncbi:MULTISPECIES: hypothetical protein [unclassified Pseudomonas]|nr:MULTISPECIES: hypothetical protein [unclassified Pseudomonas]